MTTSGARARSRSAAISATVPGTSAAGATGAHQPPSGGCGGSSSSSTSRAATRYAGPAGSLRAICMARWTSCFTLRPVRISWSYLA